MTHTTPRVLSHDEQKAAEAAFAGRPFNSDWSDAARRVYDGLLTAQKKTAPAASTPPSAQTRLAPSPTFQRSTDAPIDLTPIGRTLGFTHPVMMSSSLWRQLSSDPTDQARIQRARDIVMALQLALYAMGSAPTGLQFPALRSVPQASHPTVSLLAATWKIDPQYQGCYLIRLLEEGTATSGHRA